MSSVDVAVRAAWCAAASVLAFRGEALAEGVSMAHPSVWGAVLSDSSARFNPAVGGMMAMECLVDASGAPVLGGPAWRPRRLDQRVVMGDSESDSESPACGSCGGSGSCGRCAGSLACSSCDGVGCVRCAGSGSCVACVGVDGLEPGKCAACLGLSSLGVVRKRGVVSSWSPGSRKRYERELVAFMASVSLDRIVHVPISCGLVALSAAEFKRALHALQVSMVKHWPDVFGVYAMEDQARRAWHAHPVLSGFDPVGPLPVGVSAWDAQAQVRAGFAGRYVEFDLRDDVFEIARDSGSWSLREFKDGRRRIASSDGALVAGKDRDSGRQFLFEPGWLQRRVVEVFGLNGSPLMARLAHGARPSFHDEFDPGRAADCDSREKLRSYLVGDLAGAMKAQRRPRGGDEWVGKQWGRMGSERLAAAVASVPVEFYAFPDLHERLQAADAVARPCLRAGVPSSSMRSVVRDLHLRAVVAAPEDRVAALMDLRDALGAGVGKSGPARQFDLLVEGVQARELVSA